MPSSLSNADADNIGTALGTLSSKLCRSIESDQPLRNRAQTTSSHSEYSPPMTPVSTTPKPLDVGELREGILSAAKCSPMLATCLRVLCVALGIDMAMEDWGEEERSVAAYNDPAGFTMAEAFLRSLQAESPVRWSSEVVAKEDIFEKGNWEGGSRTERSNCRRGERPEHNASPTQRRPRGERPLMWYWETLLEAERVLSSGSPKRAGGYFTTASGQSIRESIEEEMDEDGLRIALDMTQDWMEEVEEKEIGFPIPVDIRETSIEELEEDTRVSLRLADLGFL